MYNPATGKAIGEVYDLGAEDVNLAADAAFNAFKDWSKITAKVRIYRTSI